MEIKISLLLLLLLLFSKITSFCSEQFFKKIKTRFNPPTYQEGREELLPRGFSDFFPRRLNIGT